MSTQPWLRQQCSEQVGAFRIQHSLELGTPWTVLFGPSGTGKSTWLRMLAGLLPQRSGFLQIAGEDVRSLPAYRRGVALVEQSPALFPNRDVLGNVAFACRTDPAKHVELDEMLRDFRLEGLRHAAVNTLSGGERQRVAIARALCSRPRALLLDEVFTGMDTALRTELIGTLQRYSGRMSLPILSVTHDVSEAFETAGEVLRMHDGHIVAQGPPAEVLRAEREDLLRRLSP